MQAVRIHEHGGPEVLRVEEVPRPKPGPGQVLVRVIAASVNHLDLWVRRGMPGFPVPFPRILGCDGTGEVVELGEGVDGLAAGTLVLLEPGFTTKPSAEVEQGMDHLAADYGIRGEHGDGFDAEYVAIDAHYCRPLPDGLDPVRTAATPLVFVTAWGALVERAKVREGETVLILGGASGVGSAGIQVARDLGARVIATAGSPDKRDLARDLGAEFVVDHRDPDWAKQVQSHLERRGCDVVFEHVGPATWRGSMSCLARNGRLVTCGGTTGPKVEILLPHLFIKNLSVLGSTMGPRKAFGPILERLASGAYRPVIDRVLPLREAALAHTLLEERQALGKIVLVPGDQTTA
ncbi:MAG TPA: alcohol dehydrogenase [Planctomycetes bacterium]|nr:alcohol dehydrogenase [Planctomycetota bacterium]